MRFTAALSKPHESITVSVEADSEESAQKAAEAFAKIKKSVVTGVWRDHAILRISDGDVEIARFGDGDYEPLDLQRA